MENRIDRRFQQVANDGRSVLVPYLTVGFPELDMSFEIAKAALRSGADILELGIPFSDPLADGPTIQMTSYKALQNNVNLKTALQFVVDLRKHDNTFPLIFMGYYNSFFKYGLSEFLTDASNAGLDGLIIPDLPMEESEEVSKQCFEKGVYLIPLLAPTSTDDRIELACRHAGGFIYCVSVTGVTGARKGLSGKVEDLVQRIKKFTTLPVLVGFGVSTRSDVDTIAEFADGAVVGSAFLNRIANSEPGEEMNEATNFLKELTSH